MFKKNSLQSTVDQYSCASHVIEDDLISQIDKDYTNQKILLVGQLEKIKQQYLLQKAISEQKKNKNLQKRLVRLVKDSRKVKNIFKNQRKENLYELERIHKSIELKRQILNFISNEENALSIQIHQIEEKKSKKDNSFTKIFQSIFRNN